MPKARGEKAAAGKSLRHNPLADQIIEAEESAGLRRTPRVKQRKNSLGPEDEAVDKLPPALSAKLIDMAHSQKVDEDEVEGLVDVEGGSVAGGSVGDEELLDVEVDEDGFVVAPLASEEEERALQLFLPGKSTPKAGQTLADVILQKIEEHEARRLRAKEAADAEQPAMSPKVVQVYTDIGKWMKTYKIGKMPKAFKVIPSLSNWEEVLSLTNPLTWSPAAMYEAVKIFASNLNPRMAQRFYNLVLLPAVRQDIAEHKKLNFHHFRALRKALYKPAAFFKGICLPLASENCTLKEAMILSSVLAKASIPPMHAAATLARLCVMTPWYGTTSIIMATLMNKKFALPERVIDSLVLHFCAFVSEERALPVVWHRALLVLAQRYKFELNDDHKRRLRDLMRVHCHEAMTAEIRRELLAPKPGEVPASATQPADPTEAAALPMELS